jgi:hypothetical protein
MEEKKRSSRIRVNTSFAIMPDLLKEAKDLAWEHRITFSSKMEELVRAWVEKEQKKKKA